MGGMFTILKVWEELTSYDDPGWYKSPAGTLSMLAPADEMHRDGIDPGRHPGAEDSLQGNSIPGEKWKPKDADRPVMEMPPNPDAAQEKMTGMDHSEAVVGMAPTTNAAKYTCVIHPEIISDKPGKCPKCGMKLMPKKK